MIDSLDVRVDGSIQRVAAAFAPVPRIVEATDFNVDWITRIAMHVQDGHRHYAGWCGACRRRRLIGFIEVTLAAAAIVSLAILNWWPAL